MKLILKSRFFLLKEELCVLADEINFVYDICIYHQGEEYKERSVKKDLEENFKNLAKQLLIISKEITLLDSKILNIFTIEEGKEDERELLYFIDFYQKEINKIIQKLKFINMKTSQMFRDGYNQFMPKPTPGRMVSNINMTSQVEESLEQRLKKLLGKNDSKNKEEKLSAQIIWEYQKLYDIKQYKNNDLDIVFFRMSYWYFDLPYLIPALTHEISHLALREEKNKKHIAEIIVNIKSETVSQGKDTLFKQRQIKVAFFDNIINEIVADIFSLIHHGTAYIFTMAHELLGYYFASTFEYSNTLQSLSISPWVYNDKRDNSFIRLSILLKFHTFLKEARASKKIECHEELFSSEEQYLKEIQDLLDIIYYKKRLGDSKQTIRAYYENWHNFLPEFNEIESFILFFIQQVSEELIKKEAWFLEILENTKDSNLKKMEETKCQPFVSEVTQLLTGKKKVTLEKVIDSEKKTFLVDNYLMKEIKGKDSIQYKIPHFYNDLWQTRFRSLRYDVVPHKSELRKKIHRNTIEVLLQKKLVKIEEIKPYILTFYKYKIETGNRKSKELPYESTLGIYDNIQIERENEFYFPKAKGISEKKSNSENYTLKFSMMKILTDIHGENKKGYLNAVIQMEIEKEVQSIDTYGNLTSKLIELHDYFDENKHLYMKVDFFKSLGPKDIIVRIDGMSIESIYEIKAELAKKFQRTFTTISYATGKEEELNKIKSQGKYQLSTDIRLSSNGKLLISKEFKSNIKKCFMTPGSMDYRIDWESKTSLAKIETFYKEMIGKENISDIQTLFIKDIDIEDIIEKDIIKSTTSF